jgi:probable rRNA maturation factor
MPHQTDNTPTPDIEPPPGAIVVEITDTQNFIPVDHDSLAALAARVLRGEGVSRASISIALVDDAAIHRVNRAHLDHDCPTDVISFLLSEPDEAELDGELIVSTQTTLAMAAQLEVPAWSELVLYVVHGLLHLCGYDDRTDEDARIMRAHEKMALKRESLALAPALAEAEPHLASPEGREIGS